MSWELFCMKVLFTIETLLLLLAVLYVLRIFWPVRAQVFNDDEEIIVSIRNRHNLKICFGIIIAMIMLLTLQ